MHLLSIEGLGLADIEVSFNKAVTHVNFNTGNTLVLDTFWWFCTHEWRKKVLPLRREEDTIEPKITLGGVSFTFDRLAEEWVGPQGMSRGKSYFPDWILYADEDGEYLIWHPFRRQVFKFTKKQVWNGKPSLCEGILRDVLHWELECRGYSLEGDLGPFVRLSALDSRRHPTLASGIPLIHAPSSTRRVWEIYYLSVWMREEQEYFEAFLNIGSSNNKRYLMLDQTSDFKRLVSFADASTRVIYTLPRR